MPRHTIMRLWAPRTLHALAAWTATSAVWTTATAHAQVVDTSCASCAEWNRPHAPTRIFGNTYYVGTDGLTALLVTSPQGHVLIDGALPESAPQILANIRALGFNATDVQRIVNSHAHFDHAGGLAALQAATGAPVVASGRSASWLRAGASLPDDPQFGTVRGYPRVTTIETLADSAELRVGPLRLRMWLTPGHTPGGTTWSWQSCEGQRCLTLVYADSYAPLTAPAFAYTTSPTYRTGAADAALAQKRWGSMPCDLLITPHPVASALWDRLSGRAPLVDRRACAGYADRARAAWEERLAQEAARRPGGAETWWQHVQVLAHDSLAGRETGTAGHESAARYIASQFQAAGLAPAGTDGWFQRVGFVETRLDLPNVAIAMREGDSWRPLAMGRDIRLSARLATGIVDAPIVFAGYGLSLPGANDLAGLDLRGKIVLHYNGVPRGLSAPLQAHGTRNRWTAMQQAGAVGIIAIGPPTGPGGGWSDVAGNAGTTVSLADTSFDDARGQRLGGTANPALASRFFAGSGIAWDSVVARARRGDPLPTGALTVAIRATLPTLRRRLSSPNVVGILPGTDPALRHEVVVFSAHSDHVGLLAGPALTGDSIFNGAMDNASGIATLLETARAIQARGGNRRTVAFVAVTAEEKGLLGSRYFAAKPSLGERTIVANLNTDMFLPLIPMRGLFVYGVDESDLADDINAVLTARGLAVIPDPEPQENRFVRSDQYSFIRQGIPALAFKIGYLPDTPEEKIWQGWVREHYHKLTDDVTQPVNMETAAAFNALYAELGLRVANRATRPAWRASSFFATPAR